MKLVDPKISIFINKNGTEITLTDTMSSIEIVRILLTPEQLSSALSRISHSPCEAEVVLSDKIGKRMENKNFKFEIPESLYKSRDEDKLIDSCYHALLENGMLDWVSDNYYNKQDSFIKSTLDGYYYANVVIRRWV